MEVADKFEKTSLGAVLLKALTYKRQVIRQIRIRPRDIAPYTQAKEGTPSVLKY